MARRPTYGYQRHAAQQIGDQARNHVPPDAANLRQNLQSIAPARRDRNTILIRNQTGDFLPRHSIVIWRSDTLNGADAKPRLSDPADYVFSGLRPNSDLDLQRFAVTTVPLTNLESGPAVASGFVPCKIKQLQAGAEYVQAIHDDISMVETSVDPTFAKVVYIEDPADLSGGSSTSRGVIQFVPAKPVVSAFFLIPSPGIDPAGSQTKPAFADNCQLHIFNGQDIIPALPQTYRRVYSNVTNDFVPGGIHQCKQIDGFWFVDVVDCALY